VVVGLPEKWTMTRTDRRREGRFALDRPVKVQCLETGRYLAGRTINVSPGGALVEVAHPSLLVPGQRVKLGVSWVRQQAVLAARDMAEATVVRSLGLGPRQSVAVCFDQRQELAATA
jgi:nitrous oxidase accessory protein NosD